jgi:hypothetical protein
MVLQLFVHLIERTQVLSDFDEKLVHLIECTQVLSDFDETIVHLIERTQVLSDFDETIVHLIERTQVLSDFDEKLVRFEFLFDHKMVVVDVLSHQSLIDSFQQYYSTVLVAYY